MSEKSDTGVSGIAYASRTTEHALIADCLDSANRVGTRSQFKA